MAIEIVDFPIKNGGSFHSYVKLPEGTRNIQEISRKYPWQAICSCKKQSNYWVVTREKDIAVLVWLCFVILSSQRHGNQKVLEIWNGIIDRHSHDIGPCGISSSYQYLCDPFYHWKSTIWDFRWYLDALDAARLDSSCFFAMLRSLSLLQRFASAATSTARLLLAA